MFCLILADSRHRLLARVELFRGTIDGASVHPREVVKEVLKHNAAAVILAHNHPSGVAEPTQADELITQRLREALALVDVRVLDHFIVAGELVRIVRGTWTSLICGVAPCGLWFSRRRARENSTFCLHPAQPADEVAPVEQQAAAARWRQRVGKTCASAWRLRSRSARA